MSFKLILVLQYSSSFSSAIVWTTNFDICLILTFLKLLLWSILISFSKTFFPKNLSCLSAGVYGIEFWASYLSVSLSSGSLPALYHGHVQKLHFPAFPWNTIAKIGKIKHPYGYCWSYLTHLYQNYHLWTEQDHRNHSFITIQN